MSITTRPRRLRLPRTVPVLLGLAALATGAGVACIYTLSGSRLAGVAVLVAVALLIVIVLLVDAATRRLRRHRARVSKVAALRVLLARRDGPPLAPLSAPAWPSAELLAVVEAATYGRHSIELREVVTTRLPVVTR